MNNYKVYKHIFPNNKVYIGITCQSLNRRWDKGRGYHHNTYIRNAIQKYGWSNIKHEILFTNLSKEEAESKEIELIAKYKSNQREFGYNIENGGNCTGTHGEETRRKISRSKLGNKNPMFGKVGELNPTFGLIRPKGKDCPMSKSINQYTLDGKLIKTWGSLKEITRETGIDFRLVQRCCAKRSKTTHGFLWEYKNEIER